jgi:predicted peptidase
MNALQSVAVGSFVVLWAGASTAPVSADEPTRQQTGQFETSIKVHMGYLLYLPKNYEQQQSWPLLVFLHGAGERGRDTKLVAKHGPPKLVEAGKDLPFVILSPQCARNDSWRAEALIALVQMITSKYNIDPDRVYLTGISMGGYGTFALSAAYPDRFAAIAPICGGGNPADADKIKHIPAWVFHGAKDRAEPLKVSQEMVDALKSVGGNVKFTVYPEAEHDCWTETYDNPELYHWLLKQKRKR